MLAMAARPSCTLESHDDLKQDPARFQAECTFVGLQPDGDGGLLSMWNHHECGSTLCTELDRMPTASELVELAERYAAHCRVDEVIREDDRYYLPFAAQVPAQLAKRGLHIEHVPGGWRVCRSPSK